MPHDLKLSTRCVHAGELADPQGSPFTPVYTTTTFRHASTRDLLDVIEGKQRGNLYTRYGSNPTIRSAEAKLASIEGAEAALLFTSGMAAAASLFFTHGRAGIVCVGDAYGGTLQLLEEQMPQLGITSNFLLANQLEGLSGCLEKGARLVYLETPTNPTLQIFDIAAIAELAHAHGALLAVDSTFATPINQRPLEWGADIVLHSATKYLGGHSDLTAGVLAGAASLIEPANAWRKSLGQVPAPETAALLARSLRTLPLRVQRHNETARVVATAMAQHPKVRRVLYPGLPEHPGHALARQQMTGFGGILTLEMDGDWEAAAAIADRLKLFINAPSLGGAESLVTMPAVTTHHDMNATERQRRGITDGMLRLSIGLEDAQDLIDDLVQAME